jgi:exonuclease SbcD
VKTEDGVPLEINRVGTLGAMGPGVFDARFRYVALGHIHRGFAVDAAVSDRPRVWYSGTPVQVGSVEAPDARSVLLVEVDADGATVEALRVPCRRRLVPLSGTLAEVTEAVRRLTVPQGELPPYVTAQVTLDAPDALADERVLKAAAQNTSCAPIVVQIHASVTRKGGSVTDLLPRTDERPLEPEEAFLFAWRAAHGAASSPPEPVLSRFRLLLERTARTETAR